MTTYKGLISVDDGITFVEAQEVSEEWLEGNKWNIIVNTMDDEIHEAVAFEMAPCSNRAFLEAYLERSARGIVIG